MNLKNKKREKTNILMIHVTKELDLTESPLGINLIVKCVCYFLNRNALVCFRVHSRTAKKKKKHEHKKIKALYDKKPNI